VNQVDVEQNPQAEPDDVNENEKRAAGKTRDSIRAAFLRFAGGHVFALHLVDGSDVFANDLILRNDLSAHRAIL